MKKIKTVFTIDRSNDNNLATNVVTKGAEWVLAGEGVATVKYDGTSCMIKDGKLYRRWNRKISKAILKKIKKENLEVSLEHFNPLPDGAIACNETFDPITYHFPYWIPVKEDEKADKYHLEAFKSLLEENKVIDGTYELCGEKIKKNPYKLKGYKLFKHGEDIIDIPDRSFDNLKLFLKDFNGEGIVFHRENGEMFKIRKSDMYLFKNIRKEWYLDDIISD